MQDIKIDNELNVVFNSDLKFVSDIEVQKQRLFSFFSIKKGDLFWAKDFGFDSTIFLSNMRIGNAYYIKNYLISLGETLDINLVDVSVSVLDNKLIATFYFLGNESLEIKFK